MRRFLCLLPTLLSLPLAARALDGDVTIYGTLSPFFDNLRVSGATAPGVAPGDGATQVAAEAYTGLSVPSRFRVGSGTSNIGFKGGMDILGEDLQVFFQFESAVSLDGEPPNAWGARNSAVGLKGKYGRLFLGSWDTPYKFPTLFVGPLRTLNPFDNAITGTPGFGVPATTTQSGRANAKADAAFNRRQGNSVQYWSPEISGFSARVSCSVNEGKTTETPTARSISPAIYSGLLGYTRDWLTVRYAYERHEDYFGLTQLGGSPPATPTNKGSTDQGHELVAQASFPTDTRVSAIVERLTYRNRESTAGQVTRYTRDALFASVQQRLAQHTLWAGLGVAGKGTCSAAGGTPCRTTGLGATQYSLAYAYSVARSTDLYAAVYRMVNSRSATYGVVGSPALAPGGDTTGFGVGILYTFQATATMGAPQGSP